MFNVISYIMTYLNEIVDIYKESRKDFYQITLRNNFVIIEGLIDFETYDNNSFIVKTKNKKINIKGNDIRIIKSIRGEIVLKGNINTIEVNDVK